ncbi:MAG: zinc ribbon domain-containing protein [Pyrinomonadaceae bacterium]
MAETLVENRTCSACGADVRKGALFCYHCGGAVAPEIPVSENHKPAGDAWFREEIIEEKREEENPERNEKPTEAKTEVLEKSDVPIQKPDVFEEAKLKSAASLRRKDRPFQKIRVEEVVWEEPENAPNGWFILVALILTLFAVGIFWIAVYMK